jgi:xanthine dehydrogenase molybdenum-binding subunit
MFFDVGSVNPTSTKILRKVLFFEEMILDRHTGHMLNANLIDYKWRTFSQLPVVDNVVLETPIDSHRFHAIGVGEIATSPGPSAVLMLSQMR